jgi:hypothetical protein
VNLRASAGKRRGLRGFPFFPPPADLHSEGTGSFPIPG